MNVKAAAVEEQVPESKSALASNWVTAAVFAVVALTYAAISLHRGPVFSGDSLTYSRWADLLIAAHFNYLSWPSSIESIDPPLAYSAWVTIVALNKLVLGAHWAYGILVFNLVLAIAVAFMVLALVDRLTSSRLMVVAAGIALLAAFELWLWIPYVLSDVSFMFVTFAAFYLICARAGRDGGGRWRAAAPLALALLALVYRPAGLPIASTVILATVFRRRIQSLTTDGRAAVARGVALSLALLTAIGVVLSAAIISNPDLWPFTFASAWIHELSREYAQGIVVYGRPDTYHASSSGLLAYIWLNIDRLRWFFGFTAAGFSRGHNLANFAFFVPVYLGWFAAVVALMRSKNNFGWATWWTTAVGTLFVVFAWVFHSLQYIDFDWRYRLPALPVLIVLGAIGWRELILVVSSARHGEAATSQSYWRRAQRLGDWASATRRRAWLLGGGMFLVAGIVMALITSVVYGHDSKVAATLSASTLAVVDKVQKPDFDYAYGSCGGIGTWSPLPAIGTMIRIYYNPNDQCVSVTYDPAERRRSNLMSLLAFSAVFTVAVGTAGWDAARQR